MKAFLDFGSDGVWRVVVQAETDLEKNVFVKCNGHVMEAQAIGAEIIVRSTKELLGQ